MMLSLFIDGDDKNYHFKGSWNYGLEMFETDLLIAFGCKEIIELVKSLNVYETMIQSDLVKLVRFQ